MTGTRPPDPSSVRVDGPWTHRDVHANGIRHHVAEIDGGGPLVLLLHGFPEFWWSWSAVMPGLAEYRVSEVGAGMRPVTPDALPLVGRVDERTVLAAGHGRNGIMLAPITAELVTGHLDGTADPRWSETLDPRRFR